MRNTFLIIGFCGLAVLWIGCGDENDGERPFVEGTCVRMSSTGEFGTYCVYPGSYDRNYTQGDDWCNDAGRASDGLGQANLYLPISDGSYVQCADLGFPVRCSNCTGRDFYYEKGKVCGDCDSDGGGTDGGLTPCQQCRNTCSGQGSWCQCTSECS